MELTEKWVCPNCGRSAKVPTWQTKVRCACGYAGDGRFQTVVSPSQLEPVVPSWELQQRQAICISCPDYNNERCMHRGAGLDAGCRQAYRRKLHSTTATCPAGKWVEPHVRWVRTTELVDGALQLAHRVPPDVSRVVGIPRSGMLPASAIATALHLPLYTVRSGRMETVGGGSRMATYEQRRGRTLVIDDTVHGGHTLERLQREGLDLSGSLVAAVYVHPDAVDMVDLYHEMLPTPHLLEWNLFNSLYMQHIATDLDGVICRNPPDSDVPLHLPRHVPVAAIITARPESERAETEDWLEYWGVKYSRLIMWPHGVEDRSEEAVAAWKAESCVSDGAEFYIESELSLANAIRRCGVRVLCPAESVLS